MHVQEYREDCPEPNKRRVYISYLDSVNLFEPKNLRTIVYHELLITYLKFVSELGFIYAHIWACPPSPGDDYMFHCHPPSQRVPNSKRLQSWYRDMLIKAKERNIIHKWSDLQQYFQDAGISAACEMPYFDGDFWPNQLEHFIQELNKEEQEESVTSENGDKCSLKLQKSKKSKSKSAKKTPKKSRTSNINEDLLDRAYIDVQRHKDVFFVIQLVPDLTKLVRNSHIDHQHSYIYVNTT